MRFGVKQAVFKLKRLNYRLYFQYLRCFLQKEAVNKHETLDFP